MGFWAEILALPTGLYTALLGVAGLYWLAVVLGSLDIDILDIDGLGDAGDVVDAAEAGDVDVDAEGLSGLVWFMSALGLRGVPLTFTLSMLTLWSWALCFLGMHHLPALVPLPGWLVGCGVFLGSFVVGLLGTSLSVRPFQRVFRTHRAPTKDGFVGRPVTITSGSVDATFGQALCADGGAGLVVAVRYDGPRKLTKGQRALLVDYDERRDIFTVEPLDLDDDGPTSAPPEPDRDRDQGRDRRQEPERTS